MLITKLTKELRKSLIGKTITWARSYDAHRGTYYGLRSGVVEEIKRNNMLVSGQWEWFHSMKNLEVKE